MSLSRQAIVSKAGRRQTNLPAAGPFSFAPHPWHTPARERANLDPDGVSSVEIFSRATDDTLWAVVATVAKTDRIAEVYRTRAAALEDCAWRLQQVRDYEHLLRRNKQPVPHYSVAPIRRADLPRRWRPLPALGFLYGGLA